VFEFFTKCKTLVENQSEKNIKVLITYGGGGYSSKVLEELYGNYGIDHEVTTPHTPQHNCIAERRNISILDITRFMLKQRSIQNKFWGEAVTTATYVLN
jgi:hypothetical protein